MNIFANRRSAILTAVSFLAILAMPASSRAQSQAQVAPDPGKLRICASTVESPYSLGDESGFENKIAKILAKEMGKEAVFVWSKRPAIYLVRDLLDKNECDVVMGLDTGDERVLTTKPYYRSGYVFVTRQDRNLDLKGWDDPALRQLPKIAVGFSTPAEVMLKTIGRYDDDAVYLYSLVDFRSPRNQFVRVDPGRMVNEVANGNADLAIAFAPEVGRYVKASSVPLRMTMIPDDATQANGEKVPQHFDQSIGVRKNDQALLAALDQALDKSRDSIEQVLDEEGIPTLPPQT
ncbi:amino acid ABC transporter substrate-binding protein, PAAT family [Arboricoccus pini]|uniref:Amino acid ABC transporter substrate-binding protein, PAAT family n=1 Tax=Arboricoccus pini TaxID=1963835 RepID=A0A212R0M8_9PROT|nr:methanol oxidation system protein MoxJ [Arboricoccus pini]SNB65533.1 amino acid ABC transporter substrate-binding protein, PAAT family [Arboricoccus pini]